MSSHIAIVESLRHAAAAKESVVLATVIRVVGSSYGGVGTRMVIRVDGSTVGLVSGGCLESDLCAHALEVHATGRGRVVSYDTRADDDAVWGLGLGCNGLIDVLLQPLSPADATASADLLGAAVFAAQPSVIATVMESEPLPGAPAIGAQALFGVTEIKHVGDWGDGSALSATRTHVGEALAAGRRGLVHDLGATLVAFEAVTPAVRLVICGGGPDAVPVSRLASGLGWDVTLVDHRRITDVHATRFPGARVVECSNASSLQDMIALTSRTAAVVMSHHFARDTAYVKALLTAGLAYVGVLGPRARTERMLTELATSGDAIPSSDGTLFGPVGLDLGGEGPEAIALAVVAEISAVVNSRLPTHLRDRQTPMHDDACQGLFARARIGAVVLAAGASSRMGYPKQLIVRDGKALVLRTAEAAVDAGANPVVVVLGAQADEIAPVLSDLPGLTIVVNREWESGLASSLATGLREIRTCDGVLVTLADQPLVDAEVLRRLIAAFRGGARIVASGYDGTPGVPALFGKEHIPALMGLRGDTGAGPWLRSRPDEVTIVPLEGAGLDLDTPSDSARLAGRSSPR